jgi:hypothetical protein
MARTDPLTGNSALEEAQGTPQLETIPPVTASGEVGRLANKVRCKISALLREFVTFNSVAVEPLFVLKKAPLGVPPVAVISKFENTPALKSNVPVSVPPVVPPGIFVFAYSTPDKVNVVAPALAGTLNTAQATKNGGYALVFMMFQPPDTSA